MPHLRPVRLRAGALGVGEPDEDLIVSPQHRLLIGGAPARDLFNADEVLVQAGDIVNGGSIITDSSMREVTYFHLLLERHEVLFANGIEAESFHPAFADMEALTDTQRAQLFDVLPDLARTVDDYGPAARRTLSSAEAAILMYSAA